MPLMTVWDLWDWKYGKLKFYSDVVLSMVRVKIVDESPFFGKMRYLIVVYNDSRNVMVYIWGVERMW